MTKSSESSGVFAGEDARALLRRYYQGIDGFEITRAQERRVSATKGSPIYGEIMPSATVQLLEELELCESDVFVDMGCGVGKVVLTAALISTAAACIGVELAKGRYDSAAAVADSMVQDGVLAPDRVEFRNEDMLATDLDDATIIYTCSTAFRQPFMRKLVRRVTALDQPVLFVSTQVLDPHRAYTLSRVLRLDMSWQRRTKVYIYNVNGAGEL